MIADRMEDRDLLREINADFLAESGPLLSGEKLWKAFGFGSGKDFENAQQTDALPVSVFPIEGRAGQFAYSWDVACWLVKVGQKPA